MKWTVYQFMGEWNPVCEDAGELEILLNPDESPYFRADGIVFAPSDNWQVLRRGLTCFDPYEDSFDSDLCIRKKEIRKNGVYIDLSFRMEPITTDPRVLMVMHHYYHHGGVAMTKVPTRLEAVNYLLKENALYPLMPMDVPYTKNKPLTLADLEAQGLSPDMI
ncbi:MAG: hypothetical protein ACOX6W_08860 [Lentisphaeria bacterium]|jgi:hypothetical protein